MNIFRNIYFRLYKLMIDVGNGDVAEISAVFFMSMLIGLNLIAAFGYLYAFGISKGEIFPVNKISLIFTFLLINVLIYISFVRKGQLTKTLIIFEKESKSDARKKKILIIVYILMSIVLVILSFHFMMLKNLRKI